MKVKQKMSSRRSINELGTPPQKIKRKSERNASDNTPSPAPKRFSSMYVSPLGNVAGKKREKVKPLSTLELLLASGGSCHKRKARRQKMRAIQEMLSGVLDVPAVTEVIVIPDTPTQADCPRVDDSVDDICADDAAEPRSDALEDAVVADMSETLKSAKRKRMKKKKSRNRDDESNDASVIIADETPCNDSNSWAVENSVCSDMGEEEVDDGDEKTEKREESPSDVVEILSAVSSKEKKKRKKVLCMGDVTEIPSPPKKKRKVTLGNNGVTLAVTVGEEETRAANVTIDLEAEGEAGGPTVTVTLSDEEDDNADDIIVLGSPAVPSVRGYKAVTRLQGRPARVFTQPRPDIIARAVAELGRTRVLEAPLFSGPPPTVSPSPAVPPSPANVYGGNIYNAGSKPEKKGLRPVIIDASNVAMGHGNGKVFSCRGIEICVNYFLKRKHKVFAFLPKFRRHNMYTKDAHLLDKLQSDNHLIFTPSRYVDGHSDVPYDDRYIVQTAAELGGVIVSTDNYRDLLRENPHWHDTIKNRLLMFTWVEDLLIFPQDPLGRRGCRLEEFLRF